MRSKNCAESESTASFAEVFYMLPSDFLELMTSPEIFRINVCFEDRSYEGQISKIRDCFSIVETHSLFNTILAKLFETWVTTGHGELTIRSEVHNKKIRVFLYGSPTHLFYLNQEQLAEIHKVYAQISKKAMQRYLSA